MSKLQLTLEIVKAVGPIITVVIAAVLAARYYHRNKIVDYSLKLSEDALVKVYNPILVKVESDTRNPDFAYEGLSSEDLDEIEKIFMENRHLVDNKLLSLLWEYQMISHEFLTVDKRGDERGKYERFLDHDKKFISRIKEIRNWHLKRIGFYF